MEGSIAVTSRREPSYFAACHVQGKTVEILKGVDTEKNKIACFGGRFISPVYINGEVRDIGYLADLRVEEGYRGSGILPRAFGYIRERHMLNPVPFYTTMILGGNEKARKILTSGRVGLPTYHSFGKVLTPAVFLNRPKAKISMPGITIERGCRDKIFDIFSFIRDCFRQKQFAPYYESSDLDQRRLLGLKAEDFFLAVKNNQIVGCVALWDQKDFRQMHVEGYAGALKLAKPFYNLLSRSGAFKPLPEEEEAIPYYYLSLISIKDNDPEIFRYLLWHVYNETCRSKWSFFICGLHEKDPLAKVLDEYKKIDTFGYLYCVYFPDLDVNPLESLDERIPYIEVACL